MTAPAGRAARGVGPGAGGTGRTRGPYRGVVATQVIVLNGGSSSGKSGIARCLQTVLPDPWLSFGVDTLVEAMPASLTPAAGIRGRGGPRDRTR